MRRFLLLALMAVALFSGAQIGAALGPRALTVRLSDQTLVAYLLRDGRLLLSTSNDWRAGGLRLVTIEPEEAGRYFNSLDALRSTTKVTADAVIFSFDDGPPIATVPRPDDGVAADRDLAALADAFFRTIRMGGGGSLPVGTVSYRARLVPVETTAAAADLPADLLPLSRYSTAAGALLSAETLQRLRAALAQTEISPLISIDGTTFRLSIWVDPSPDELTALPVDPALAPSTTP
jgi:hypothetical protein